MKRTNGFNLQRSAFILLLFIFIFLVHPSSFILSSTLTNYPPGNITVYTDTNDPTSVLYIFDTNTVIYPESGTLTISNVTILGTSTITNASLLNGTATGTTLSNVTVKGSSTITNASILNGTVTSATITNASVLNGTVTSSTITNASILNGTITSATITNASVLNGTVTSSTITNASILNGTVTSATITNASVLNGTVTSSTITNASILNGTVTGSTISNATLLGSVNGAGITNFPSFVITNAPLPVINTLYTNGTQRAALDLSIWMISTTASNATVNAFTIESSLTNQLGRTILGGAALTQQINRVIWMNPSMVLMVTNEAFTGSAVITNSILNKQ